MMKRATLLAIPAALLGLLLPIGVALGQQTPPRPTAIYRSTFETVAPGTPFDLTMTVNELEPGAWSPPHTHSSTAFITVLEGEWTNVRIVDGQRAEPVTYKAGDTTMEPAWGTHEAGNLSAERTRFLVTRLQPKDAPGTINLPIESLRPGAPPSRAVYQARSEVVNISGPIDVYQGFSEWPPGSRLGAHIHPGVELAIVTEGELTSTKAVATTWAVGESVANAVGEVHSTANNASETARVVTTHLIVGGAPQTFPME